MASSSSAWVPPGRPDIGAEGTAPKQPGEYQSALLNAHGAAIAAYCTRRFYELWPELLARYGERGREHTHEDQFWHLTTLDTALLLESPPLFLEYVQWLRSFLAGRGMGDDITGANFVLMKEALASVSLTPEQASERQMILGYMDRAIALFAPEAP
ncbi:MAG: hypothetical protein ACK46X_06815 [Candidatus Sericytochromatia bacterium]